MNDFYRILHLEDVATDAELASRELKKNNIGFVHEVIETEKEFINALDTFSPDLILCDHSLPSFNSYEALKIVRSRKLHIPFILVTATMSEDVAMSVVSKGADDYILKDRLKRLPNAVINAIEKYRHEKERKQLFDEVYEREALSKERLKKLSDKLLLATHVAGIGIWEYCLAQNKFVGNEMMFSLYGITAANFDGSYESWIRSIHPDDKQRVNQEFGDALVKLSDLKTEFRVIWPDKSIHFIKAVGQLQYDADGNSVRLIGTHQDITADKAAEKALRESEAKYRSFFETSMDGILLSEPDGRIVAANPASCDILKMTEAEICNAGRTGIIDDKDPRLPVLFKERLEKGKVKGEITFVRKDGSKFPGEFTSAVFEDATGKKKASVILRDVTERKKAEESLIHTSKALQQALNDLEKIMNSSLDIICTIDKEGRFANVSSASEHIWGYTQEELRGQKYIDFVFPRDVRETKKVAAGIMAGVPVTVFENRYVHKKGNIVPVLWSARWDERDELMYCIAKDASEKKRLERAFEEERQRFYDLFRQAPSSVSVFKGPDHIYEMANPHYLKIIGKKGIIGKKAIEVLPEVAEQGLISILDEVFKSGKSYSAKEKLIRLNKKGNGQFEDIYSNFIFKPYKNNEGIIDRIFFFSVDVTKEVLSRRKIEESEKRFRKIVETAQEGIWMIDENNKTTFVNKKMCEILEYSEKEMLNSNVLSYKDEEGQRHALQQIERRKRGIKETYDSKYITKSGRRIWAQVSTNPIFSANGTYAGELKMITDITDRKLAEEILRENQQQLLESQRIAHVGSWQFNFFSSDQIDINTTPVYCSEETYRIFGFPPIQGKISYFDFSQLIHPDDREMVKTSIEKAIAQCSSYSIDFRIITKNGSERCVHQEARVITDVLTGKPVKMFGTISDITLLKEHELQIQKNSEERELLIRQLTKSLKDLQQFSFITSHNFKAPLSNLIGLLSLVDYSDLSEENKVVLEMFKVSTFQLNKTINDLVDILIIKNNVNVDIADNNIKDLLNEICNSLAYKLNEIGCVIHYDLQIENVSFNRSYLNSVLINLLSNAIKYRSPNRTLQINISTRKKADGDVLLKIEDNGLGIDLNRHRKNIFGLYQRFHSNADSVGLGLFMIKSQLNALGGEIDVESEVDKGTSFHITFKKKKINEA